MISVDTSVVVRLLTGDDQAQFERAKVLFAKESITITTSVILECEWVLRYAYHFKPLKIADVFQALFGISNVKLQEQLIIYDAIQWCKHGTRLLRMPSTWRNREIPNLSPLLTKN